MRTKTRTTTAADFAAKAGAPGRSLRGERGGVPDSAPRGGPKAGHAHPPRRASAACNLSEHLLRIEKARVRTGTGMSRVVRVRGSVGAHVLTSSVPSSMFARRGSNGA